MDWQLARAYLICQTHAEAEAELEQMINQSKFGDASKKVVVEEFLDGIELSVFVLCDGTSYKILPSAKDYQRIGEGVRLEYRRHGSHLSCSFCG
jgi:phosphoribosylamine--glycine ligase